MKKSIIFLTLGLHLFACGQDRKFLERIDQRAKIPKEAIDIAAIKADFLKRFERELKSFYKFYTPVYQLLENLNNYLIFYSKQPLEYQKNYRNVAHFESLINQIRQKDLTIAITKLLQYKTPYINGITQQAEKSIDALDLLLQNIDSVVDKLASNKELSTRFIDTPPDKIKRVTVINYFKYYVKGQLFFKLKKIRRSIINWRNKQLQ